MQSSRRTSPSGTWQPDLVTQQEAPERLTREEKKARTRVLLIDAAATVFARRGFVAASLDEVAEEAGLTKGAVYSNFESKDDLFQAVMDDRLNEPMLHVADDIRGSTDSAQEQAMLGARAFTDAVERERDVYLLGIEFDVYVARHPEYAPQFANRWREQFERIAGLIEEASKDNQVPLPMTAEEMAVVVTALSQGMTIRRLVNPEAVPDDLLGRVYALLFQLPAES
jgi:AcrR family transcriptional regulator